MVVGRKHRPPWFIARVVELVRLGWDTQQVADGCNISRKYVNTIVSKARRRGFLPPGDRRMVDVLGDVIVDLLQHQRLAPSELREAVGAEWGSLPDRLYYRALEKQVRAGRVVRVGRKKAVDSVYQLARPALQKQV